MPAMLEAAAFLRRCCRCYGQDVLSDVRLISLIFHISYFSLKLSLFMRCCREET
jgi:hypothetical protein